METDKKPKMLKGNPANGGKLPIILITPSMLIIFGVLIFPIVYSLVLSFNNLVIKDNTMEWVGLKNYADMFADANWRFSVKQTLIFTVISVFCEIVIGVGVALVLNKEFKGRGFVRGIMILPWALPGVVNAIMWKWIFNANYGAFNALMMQLGFIDKYQAWLATPKSAFICVLVANIWKETPYVVLLTIAALANIDKGLYEAASIDGANGWKSFWTITLPLIKPVLLILLITKTIWALQTYDLVYLMTAGGPMGYTEFLTYMIQKNSFKYLKWGYGSAMAFTLSVICFIMTLIYIKVFMGDDGTKRSGRKKGGKA